jgi:hypothetical protein
LPLASEINGEAERQRNHVRLVFTHPTVRRLYADWEASLID